MEQQSQNNSNKLVLKGNCHQIVFRVPDILLGAYEVLLST